MTTDNFASSLLAPSRMSLSDRGGGTPPGFLQLSGRKVLETQQCAPPTATLETHSRVEEPSDTPKCSLFSSPVYMRPLGTLNFLGGAALWFHKLILSHWVFQGGVHRAKRKRNFYYPPISYYIRENNLGFGFRGTWLKNVPL